MTSTPTAPPEPAPPPNRRAFWDQHPGLVWSNRNAPDDAFISAALRKNRFLQLLDMAKEFGPERLRRQWLLELAEGDIPAWFVATIEENLQIIEQARARAAVANPLESPHGPKAQTIPARGNVPGTDTRSESRAESPSHHPAPRMMERAFSPAEKSCDSLPGALP